MQNMILPKKSPDSIARYSEFVQGPDQRQRRVVGPLGYC